VIDKKLAMPKAATIMMKKKNNAPIFFDMTVPSLWSSQSNVVMCRLRLENRLFESQA
jgi:hypothetical protein